MNLFLEKHEKRSNVHRNPHYAQLRVDVYKIISSRVSGERTSQILTEDVLEVVDKFINQEKR